MFGYMGQILRIDLTNKKATVEPLKEEVVKKFIGGRGLGAKILWDELSPGVDPLSPQNKLVFVVGPLTGTKAQSTSRWIAQFKSPLTGTYFRSVAGGFFGAELKFAGYDAIIVEGRSEKPVYVWINDGEVEFRDAEKIWGMTTNAAREFLLEETDRRARIAMIGPAGERLVKISAIVTDDMRTASRGGGGAVMGSKNLKAIVVRGTKRPEIYDEDAFNEAVKEQIESYRSNPGFEGFHNLGTNFAVYPFYTLGHFPTYNFKQKELEGAERFQAEVLRSYIVKHQGCYGCMIRCGKTFKLTKGPYAGTVWDFPEYETHWSFGGNLGNINIESIVYANMLCDSYGLDTISTGVAIAFAIELYEKGIISKSETDGLELRWGDPDVIPELVKRIALRIGLGNILAEGTKRAAEVIGRGAEKYAIHVKGLELPAYDPRSAKAHGLNLATSPIGASHCIGWNKFEIMGIPKKVDPFATEGKGEIAKYVQDETAIAETAVFCIFPFNTEMVTVDLYSKLLYAATGIEEFKDPKYLWLVGERIFNLERAFNAREGIDGKYDTMPERIVKEPVPREPSKGQVFELDILLKDYYKVRGWDERGIPTKEKLKELELQEVAEELEKVC
ncbi:aldehyde ferredoxin oxidoreductase family protein [Thermococcus sp. LS2]|uniref:aldehyde ferredoxin oxidoreductase family protein n=1 Tax=Thermococcus sp. LS2 TaxID=1638260 RepID=UPI00143A991B|nr:aldehyde ferredoxin oxidoreductase family protein [Thermococcus sp. LS2]NJE13860.1 aldehyde ferredoxin oxidoreductase [Thermococcus sp. LS2]